MYFCPMHPEVRQATPGTCPKCGMVLVEVGSVPTVPGTRLIDFLPLIVLLALVATLTAMTTWWQGNVDPYVVMRQFEGYFFLIFAGFKLLNLRGFVDAYTTYDLIAKRSRAYAYAYPFIELALGLGYLGAFQVRLVAATTLVLMTIGAIGVAQELQKKRQIPCACLGVVFKIPMTWVTFLEDIVMALMALAILLR